VTEWTRRSVLAAGAALAGLAVWPTRPAPADPGAPPPPLEQCIGELEARYHARVGLLAVDLSSGRTATNRAGELFALCSAFKGYAAARVVQMSERGQLRLADGVFVDPSAILPNSPRTTPNAGTTMTLAELCAAALQVSDNTAANLLLQTIGGPQAVTAFARDIGDDTTRLDRWEPELNTAIPGDPRDTSTPRALGTGYRNLLDGGDGAALGDSSRQQLQDWMRANQTSTVRAGLPTGWTTADKTGTGDYGSTNDVGIAYGPTGQRLLLSIMTRSAADDPNAPSLRRLIGELTPLVLATLTR
jgi:beta-lactamase class A